jgi:hypothetical protein
MSKKDLPDWKRVSFLCWFHQLYSTDAFRSAHGALAERLSALHGSARSRRTGVSTARMLSGNASLTRRTPYDPANTRYILV